MTIGIRLFLLGLAASIPVTASAEILALLNYESKPDDSLKELKMPFGAMGRKEGIGIIEVDPESDTYGQMLMDIRCRPTWWPTTCSTTGMPPSFT